MFIDIALALIAGKLLYNQYCRRQEVVDTIKNLNDALGYTKKNVYLDNRAINAPSSTRFWFPWFIFGITLGVVGLGMILFVPTQHLAGE